MKRYARILLGWVLFSMYAMPALSASGPAVQSCLNCHDTLQYGFSTAHAAFARNCTQCHAGNAAAKSMSAAHLGLITFPGNLNNAMRTCGSCHADKVKAVTHSLMHTGAGMITTTRAVFGESTNRPGHNDLTHLMHTPADSLLRKLCASCHLGQPKTVHRLDATLDRGGGCLACHINHYPQNAHPSLTAQVNNARCFGCHSRSSRISLNYIGLAETNAHDIAKNSRRLEDGRLVTPHPDDVHHAAGMSCIDCHTEVGVMGIGQTARHESAAVDIACDDCHANHTSRIDAAHWPTRFRALLAKVPFPVTKNTQFFVTARNGTPLWNIKVTAAGAWLYPKLGGEPLRIPPLTAASHPFAKAHRRLSCDACHSQWAPQCYTCHLSYDSGKQQWDHIAHLATPGAWVQQRANVRNALPPLGIDAMGRIVPVVPGMIMTVIDPAWSHPRFVRRFAALSPHTTGPARSCESCHRSSVALGLGRGSLIKTGNTWHFTPAHPLLDDGLPADAWTRLSGATHPSINNRVHPFSAAEIRLILSAPIKQTRVPVKR